MSKRACEDRRLLIVTLAVLALTGCGGQSASDAVRATLTRFGQATDRHDYATLCRDVFTRELIQGLLERGLPCERALQIGLANVSGARLEVQRVSVHGDQAQAFVRSTAAGEVPATDTVELVREAGGWRIARLAPTVPAAVGTSPPTVAGPRGPTAATGPIGPSSSTGPAGPTGP